MSGQIFYRLYIHCQIFGVRLVCTNETTREPNRFRCRRIFLRHFRRGSGCVISTVPVLGAAEPSRRSSRSATRGGSTRSTSARRPTRSASATRGGGTSRSATRSASPVRRLVAFIDEWDKRHGCCHFRRGKKMWRNHTRDFPKKTVTHVTDLLRLHQTG